MDKTCVVFPTDSPGRAAWVADPSCRGTFGIILLCFSTTVICVWSSVHRDIPIERLPGLRALLRDAPLILVALLAPELLFFFAFNQYLCARKLVEIASKMDGFESVSDEGRRGDSKTQKLLNFFRMEKRPMKSERQSNDAEDLHDESEVKSQHRQNAFTIKHGFYAMTGGFTLFPYKRDGTFSKKRAKVSFEGVRYLLEHDPGLILDLSLASITDRSISSALGKAILAVQVLCFCLNCVSRLASVENLPLSLLEISTLAHGFTTLLSYAAWWSKPLNIDEPTLISPNDPPKRCENCLRRDQEQGRSALITDPEEHHPAVPFVLEIISINSSNHTFQSMPGVNDSISFDNTQSDTAIIFTGIRVVAITIAYGTLHILGWHAGFATTTERRPWRIASVSVASSGVAMLLLGYFALLLDMLSKKFAWRFRSSTEYGRSKNVFKGLSYLEFLFYTLCSMFLLVESIRQLWFLPPKAFLDASWAYYIPHWF